MDADKPPWASTSGPPDVMKTFGKTTNYGRSCEGTRLHDIPSAKQEFHPAFLPCGNSAGKIFFKKLGGVKIKPLG
jgi:hypothetical protein